MNRLGHWVFYSICMSLCNKEAKSCAPMFFHCECFSDVWMKFSREVQTPASCALWIVFQLVWQHHFCLFLEIAFVATLYYLWREQNAGESCLKHPMVFQLNKSQLWCIPQLQFRLLFLYLLSLILFYFIYKYYILVSNFFFGIRFIDGGYDEFSKCLNNSDNDIEFYGVINCYAYSIGLV